MTKLYYNSIIPEYVLDNGIDKDIMAYENNYNEIALRNI